MSPTLYSLSFYKRLIRSGSYITTSMFAADIIQVITHPSKSKAIMELRVEREIEKKKHERTWKIKTSEEKNKNSTNRLKP